MTGRAGSGVIGFDVTAALTQGGGIGRYTRELIHSLVAEAPQYAYTLFSARPPAAPPVPDPLPVAPDIATARVIHRPAPLDERWLYRLWYRARLPVPVQLFTGHIDLFHSPDFVLPPVGGDVPTILTVHDLSFIHYPATFPPRLVAYLNRVVPWSVARATHVLADSEATRRDLQAEWGVAEDKITVLYSGVHERFRPANGDAISAARAAYGLEDAPYVLAVGTVQPRKNYEMLVRAFRPVAELFPHNLIIVGGKGWLDEGLPAEIRRQGLGDRVRPAGFVADADLPALYSGADLFVFPSLYEGFGLPLRAARACGTPERPSDASSLPDVVGRGQTRGGPEGAAAVLLPPHDEAAWSAAMLRLLGDGEARRRLSAAGLAQSRHFSWQTAARELAGVYGRLLAGRH